MSWTAALKEYAKITGKFGVPKKGTPEYAAVVKIQNKLKGIPDPEEVKAEKIKKERKKKEEAMPKPPTEEEIKKKAEEDKIMKEQADKKAIEDAIAAKAANKAAKIALKDKLKKEKEELAKQAEEQAKNRAISDGKLGAEAATKMKLKTTKPTKEEIEAHKEFSIKKIKEKADKKVEKKLAAREGREPTFRIEDKQIIISFRE